MTTIDFCMRPDDGYNSCCDYTPKWGDLLKQTELATNIVISERNGGTPVTVSRWVETQ